MMTKNYEDNQKEWTSLDDKVWCEASGGKRNGYFYGVPALLDSTKLPGGRPRYPVMYNIVSTGSNSVIYYLLPQSNSNTIA
jgi:hypothetical protein